MEKKCKNNNFVGEVKLINALDSKIYHDSRKMIKIKIHLEILYVFK